MAIAKKIEGYPEYYVSSAGNVWSKYKSGFYTKLRPNKEGHVQLYNDRGKKYILIYRIVAMAFIPISEEYKDIPVDELEVHHIDFDHNNNRKENLMWVTPERHKEIHRNSCVTKKRRSEVKKGIKFTDEHRQNMSKVRKGIIPKANPPKAVIQHTLDGKFVAKYPSMSEASRQTKVNLGDISMACNGKLNSAGGYKWSYA